MFEQLGVSKLLGGWDLGHGTGWDSDLEEHIPGAYDLARIIDNGAINNSGYHDEGSAVMYPSTVCSCLLCSADLWVGLWRVRAQINLRVLEMGMGISR